MNLTPARCFAAFRIAFGSYLAIHFLHLIPWGTELFGQAGLIPEARWNLTLGLFPSPLNDHDSPLVVTTLLSTGALAAGLYAAGLWRRTSALVLWFIWTALFHRNNLISNPGLPYVGLLLILSTLVPLGEGWTLSRRFCDPQWKMPRAVLLCAWILLAAGYSFSGWAKLTSPSWVDGSALSRLLDNPLARTGLLRQWMQAMPGPPMQLATWGALALELTYLALILWRPTRLASWLAMVAMHIGILFVLDFADLTLGMLMIHAFVFDPQWMGRVTRERGNGGEPMRYLRAPGSAGFQPAPSPRAQRQE